jgi:hypothetical protein
MVNKVNYGVSIKRSGLLNYDLFKIIAYNNEGKQDYSLSEIECYLKCKIAEYPSTLSNMKTLGLEDELTIMEDGENITLIIRIEK